MAMNKAEKAELDKARRDLRLAKSMRWPEYPMPKPMTKDEIEQNLTDGDIQYGSPQRVARGWFSVSYRGEASYGCSNGINHSPTGGKTTTQGIGAMYRTELQALQVTRLRLTEEYAARLAAIDARIQELSNGHE